VSIVRTQLDKSAEFYEKVFGFKRLGAKATPEPYPDQALDLSDSEVNYSSLFPDERKGTSPWARGTSDAGPVKLCARDAGEHLA
jgi:catechol 2,3-dioxygenase-like lactoylglutathione lyase family enzyme